MSVVAEKGLEAPVVADFVKSANVSHGTFYNYFTSRDHVIEELTLAVEKERVRRDDQLRATVSDLAERLIIGARLNVLRAIADGNWSRFTILQRMERMMEGTPHDSGPRYEIISAIQAGQLPEQDVDLAVGIVDALMLQGLCMAANGSGLENLDELIATAMLSALGMPYENAKRIATQPLPALLNAPEAKGA